MKQLDLNQIIPRIFLLILLAFGSAISLADEYFQDAVFEELQKVGVDTQTFKSKLNEGDFTGAKALLEQEKDKTSLSDVEEEVASLIARRVVRKVRAAKENKEQQNTELEPVEEVSYSNEIKREMPVEKVRLDGEDEPSSVQLRKQVSGPHHIPGEEVSPYSGLVKAVGHLEPLAQPARENTIDREALKRIGVRELVPGMSIFRFLKVQVKVWSRLNHKGDPS